MKKLYECIMNIVQEQEKQKFKDSKHLFLIDAFKDGYNRKLQITKLIEDNANEQSDKGKE